MKNISEAKRIVIKIGTSTLAYETGMLNIRNIEKLVKVVADLKNAGKEIIIVSSGAIGVGKGKLRMEEPPQDTPTKQALAAIGQCELMYMYDKLFTEYNHVVSQVLVTKDVIDTQQRKTHVTNTFLKLLELGSIPIVNENDTVSVEEIEIGDNDTLSAMVAVLVGADLLIILSDIDGLYTANPAKDANATLLPFVKEITPDIVKMASGTASSLGTGGMATKIEAGKIVTSQGIGMAILNGNQSNNMYELLDGKPIGTYFQGKDINQ